MLARRELLGTMALLMLLQGCGAHMDELEQAADPFGLTASFGTSARVRPVAGTP